MRCFLLFLTIVIWLFEPLCAQKTFSSSSLFSAGNATIMLDIGHGGTDRGARANSPFCEEKRICLQTGRLVKKYLDQLGYRVIMTRSTDVFVSLPRRVEMADQARAALFVSIHYNSAPASQAKGIEVFYPESKERKMRSSASKKLAQAILSKVIHRTSAVSRGVKKGNFYVIRETSMPAVIVEGGFISNPQERVSLKDHEYIDQIARGIADGIDQYYRGKVF